MADEKSQHTIVLKSKQERIKVLEALEARGGKIIHDSGERVLIIEVPKRTRLRDKLPTTTKLLKHTASVKREISRPSANELLFIDAFMLKNSQAFINEKKLRLPGSTPEELEMFEESDYLGDGPESI